MTTQRISGPAQLREAYRTVDQRIGEAAARANRKRDDVILVAVTKYASPDQIRQVVELGQADLGESRVQQLGQRVPQLQEFLSRKKTLAGAAAKTDDLTPAQIRWHMIGQLQRNKVKQVVPYVNLIHSVDSLRLAEELHNFAARADLIIDVLLQVNVSGEASKGGIAAPAVLAMIESLDTMLHLRPRGLMTMAPQSDNPEAARPVFARTRELFEDCKAAKLGGEAFTALSMGMTDDFEIAIEEGANLVRVGRALFGETES